MESKVQDLVVACAAVLVACGRSQSSLSTIPLIAPTTQVAKRSRWNHRWGSRLTPQFRQIAEFIESLRICDRIEILNRLTMDDVSHR
jgi:hypothetical protein